MTSTALTDLIRYFNVAKTKGDVILRPQKNVGDKVEYSNQEALINGVWLIRNRVDLKDAAFLFDHCPLSLVWGFKKIATEFHNWHLEPEPIVDGVTEDEHERNQQLINKLQSELKNLQGIIDLIKEEEPALINRIALQFINDNRRNTITSAQEDARTTAEKLSEQQAASVKALLNF
ncbi:hypothetical protein [Thalassotalea crassostreae]|uniref:hypothetical protein n=1 Tax=Thalassotalea crassostreae TaxID=1763536 RepID=UPI0008383DA8|nr:hypothetical protein [Thalassotalea crassostreae]